MCTYVTRQTPLRGAAKSAGRWEPVGDACVYVDHPFFSADEHTLNIDLRDAGGGVDRRVALELDLDSARQLAGAIEAALRDFEIQQHR